MPRKNSRAAARLTSLYEAHSADVFRYALHLTGRREDAEDVVQHVFLQTYSALEAGRELVNPRAWLMKATKHRSLNLIRDRRDTPTAEIDPPAPFAAGEGETEALAGVRAALWSLPETQHHAFVLRHWSGLSQDEIADVLATTPGAVESLLVRARATLVAEREEGDPQCAGVRERLARMIAPTVEQRTHLAGCRRCRTAQTRLLRASEFATAFALVPSPHVLHALASAIPGFGASGAVAGASASAAAGTGGGGAAVSTVSAATKVGILTKVAVVATTAAVAVTAVHPVRTAVTHAIFRQPPARAAAPAVKHPAAHAAASTVAGPAREDAGAPVAGLPPATNGSGDPATGNAGKGHGATQGKPGGDGAAKGKSGTAGSNGNGKGHGAGGASGTGAQGKSGTAPGRTKAGGSKPAAGRGTGNGKPSGKGTPSGKGHGHAGSAPGGTSNPPGTGAASGDAGGNGKGRGNGNGDGMGNGTP